MRTLKQQIEILQDINRQLEREIYRYYSHENLSIVLNCIISELLDNKNLFKENKNLLCEELLTKITCNSNIKSLIESHSWLLKVVWKTKCDQDLPTQNSE